MLMEVLDCKPGRLAGNSRPVWSAKGASSLRRGTLFYWRPARSGQRRRRSWSSPSQPLPTNRIEGQGRFGAGSLAGGRGYFQCGTSPPERVGSTPVRQAPHVAAGSPAAGSQADL